MERPRDTDIQRDYLAAAWSLSLAALSFAVAFEAPAVWRRLAAGFVVLTTIAVALRWILRRRLQ
jgi:hypothetical protein